MKRILALVLMVFVALPMFAGGGTESSTTDASLASVDPSGVTITYWYQHSRSREEAIQKLIAEFNETNAYGITVEGEYAGGYNDIYNKMITGIAGGDVPNVVVAYQNQSAGYQVANALVDLNPYVNDEKWGLGEEAGDYFKGFTESDVNAMFDGQRLGFPPNRSMEVMYYNLTWLKELGYNAPPKTWAEFEEMVQKATETGDGDQYGYALATGASNVFSLIISRGGEVEKDGGGYNYNSSEARDAMEMMKRLYDAGYARRIVEAYGEQTDFGNFKVLFTMASTSGLPYYASAIESSDRPFEWGVAPFPTVSASDQAVQNVYGASLSVTNIGSTPEEQLASWLFIKFLTGKSQQAVWVRESNYFPVRASVADDLDDYFGENPQFKLAFDILTSSELTAEPPYAGYDEVRDVVSSTFNAILDGADIESALADLDEEAEFVYEDAKP
jgi:multiple sugar transport system substrate-binding protein